mmetsp:Transcript_13260/g.26952  ORF Transcript_13260/g.26952 Transcript_13260/m.26952 type:complete len:86 (-) Transcript_13260:1938-2195(-)
MSPEFKIFIYLRPHQFLHFESIVICSLTFKFLLFSFPALMESSQDSKRSWGERRVVSDSGTILKRIPISFYGEHLPSQRFSSNND